MSVRVIFTNRGFVHPAFGRMGMGDMAGAVYDLPDIFREEGKIGHPIDVVGLFGSAEFLIYFGMGVLWTAILHDQRPLLAGVWAVAIMSHLSLLQRIFFTWRRYRHVDPGLLLAEQEASEG